MTDLESLRLKVRPLLHFSAPGDALAVYYAFYHDPGRTELYVHEREDNAPSEWRRLRTNDAPSERRLSKARSKARRSAGVPSSGGAPSEWRRLDSGADGFVAVCQTGQRLFQPTVVLRTPDADAAVDLLRQALTPGRPYYVITTPDLRDPVTEVVEIEQSEINRVYRLELLRFHPTINVLVVTEQGPGGQPRFIIRSHEEIVAEAGVNWSSPHFAEVFVHTAPASRRRGWGRAVLTACTTWIVRSARQPLYIVHEQNKPAIALAEAVGYVDSGAREFAGEGICRPPD